MLADIRRAQERVWLESYIFADDSVGRLVASALQERAHAGVDVRVIYDAIGSQATASAFFTDMQAAGVKVQVHHTIWETLFRRQWWTLLNRRNHRKTMIIDHLVAYFGGMNLIDPVEAQASAGWRDVHVRMVGPQVADVADSFERSWRREHHQRVRRRPLAYRRGVLPFGAGESIRFFDSGPGPKQSRAARVFARLMRTARREVLLSMAYFIPAGRVLRELLRARKRGVRVRVVVPCDNDVKLVRYALRHMYLKLLRRGIEIYERQDCMLHSKAMVVDDAWSIVGSCNLDPRSLELNYEFLAAIRSTAFAAELRKVCENEIAHSRPVTLDHCNRRTWRQRLVDQFAYSLRYWL
jgi:cardiolipin synthase